MQNKTNRIDSKSLVKQKVSELNLIKSIFNENGLESFFLESFGEMDSDWTIWKKFALISINSVPMKIDLDESLTYNLQDIQLSNNIKEFAFKNKIKESDFHVILKKLYTILEDTSLSLCSEISNKEQTLESIEEQIKLLKSS